MTFFFNFSLSLIAIQALSLLPSTIASPQFHGVKDDLVSRQSTDCVNSATDRACWGEYDLSTNYYDVVPDTGVTREYWFDIVNSTLAPDGVDRVVLSVNGSVPGPTIEADWGDTVIVHMTNSLQNNGSTIHFHGIRQNYTVQNDGVPSLTQCPTAPGESYTYTWRALQYGSSWYHSHYSLQAWDGVFGGIVIHGPATANYDVDMGSLLIQDWSHVTAASLADYDKTLGPPTLDTGLINGTNVWEDGGSYYETEFIGGTSYLFRVVNVAIDTFFKFSVDNHTMTVIAMDFVPIEPFETDILDIGIAERYDVIINATESVGNYWMRSIPQVTCSNNDNVDGILGIIRYEGADDVNPTTTAYNYTDSCDDFPLTSLVPYLALDAGSEDLEDDLEVSLFSDTDGVLFWAINNSSMVVDWSDPTLMYLEENVTSFNTSDNVYEIANANEWSYIILEQTTGPAHPIHLHGHDFYVLAVGTGTYASAAPTLQTTNPTRRDVIMLPAEGYLVIAFPADNPGTWLCHCHIGWHQDEGLDLQFIERRSEIDALVNATTLDDTCAAWNDYLAISSLVQDNSGV